MKKIVLIGSTGSIGRQVIDVCLRHPDEFKIIALVSGSESAEFGKQKSLIKPLYCATAESDRELALSLAALPEADIIFNAAGGFAGVEYSLAAVNAGKTLALANKETLVCAGDIILPAAKTSGAKILPVDSEHSAIWQCLGFDNSRKVKRLIITASGGAFRDYTPEMLKGVTPEQALAHPTWQMGKKITVDSATLMNKGYEVIEANKLFGTDYKDIEAVIQPQSVIHSLVEYDDGAVLAQMSYPTMEIPIQLALSYPERLATSVKPMDFKSPFSLDFKPLDTQKYPCFELALKCGRAGGIMPCVLNAADEVAVAAFLGGRIAFTEIYGVVQRTVNEFKNKKVSGFAELAEVDRSARETAKGFIYR